MLSNNSHIVIRTERGFAEAWGLQKGVHGYTDDTCMRLEFLTGIFFHPAFRTMRPNVYQEFLSYSEQCLEHNWENDDKVLITKAVQLAEGVGRDCALLNV